MSGSYATRLAVTVFALLVGGCDLFGEQTQRGRVLDQDTGEPIAGAIVVGRYMGGISWGGSSCNRAESAVSDAQGWFELPVDKAAGPVLKEAYKRGYQRGNPTRIAFNENVATNSWRVAVHKWNENNSQSEIIRVEPEIYQSEPAALAASGERVDVYVRRSQGERDARLLELHVLQSDCAGPPKSTKGLAPFIEAILAEQTELGDTDGAINISRRRLENAHRQYDQVQARGK